MPKGFGYAPDEAGLPPAVNYPPKTPRHWSTPYNGMYPDPSGPGILGGGEQGTGGGQGGSDGADKHPDRFQHYPGHYPSGGS